ncbi:MAG: NUDIX domain-containing protein [Chitinophagia bacterium]|nr:NUDIX domain-containing protein [Chitinophagia bacterium]
MTLKKQCNVLTYGNGYKKSMTEQNTAISLLNAYLSVFPEEGQRCALLQQYLLNTMPLSVIDRKNAAGHITASAFIIVATGTHLLLHRHAWLNRWLQPGGHIEANDTSFLAAAMRETEEELQLTPDAYTVIHLDSTTQQLPFDIDSHLIPANAKKQEPAHYHHDFRYLFQYKHPIKSYTPPPDTTVEWFTLNELQNDAEFGNIVTKIKHKIALKH